MLDFFQREKRFVVTGALVLSTILFLGFFRESATLAPAIQGAIVSLIFFLVIPILFCRIVLREPVSLIGFQSGKWLPGVFWTIVVLGLGAAAIFGLVSFTDFELEYRFPIGVERSFLGFVLYEVLIVGGVTLLYEVFFRGLVMLLWLKRFGVWSVLFQSTLFFGLIGLSGMSWQSAPLLIGSVLAGTVAYFSRSIWYSWFASWLFLFLTDVVLLIIK